MKTQKTQEVLIEEQAVKFATATSMSFDQAKEMIQGTLDAFGANRIDIDGFNKAIQKLNQG